ncbi:hypothetical protein FIBSPDRAFT_1001482 [Athelia psychrophila]|uniref:Uncharacterized protein n=1 Tax=Athelia psychrophila TaxID=1759441 RepID=A0A166QEN5_9AGAM|nr:hypothetical protein FIBSPDRAFT_1001482 [Fibularhizoctonia sp. CBS 109695]
MSQTANHLKSEIPSSRPKAQQRRAFHDFTGGKGRQRNQREEQLREHPRTAGQASEAVKTYVARLSAYDSIGHSNEPRRERYLTCELCNSPHIGMQAGDANGEMGGLSADSRTRGYCGCMDVVRSSSGRWGCGRREAVADSSRHCQPSIMIKGTADAQGMPSETGGNSHAYVVAQKGAWKPLATSCEMQGD